MKINWQSPHVKVIRFWCHTWFNVLKNSLYSICTYSANTVVHVGYLHCIWLYTDITYCVMLSNSPSSQNSSPVAVCWSSSATNSEKLFCLVAVVVSSGYCIGMIYPPRTWITISSQSGVIKFFVDPSTHASTLCSSYTLEKSMLSDRRRTRPSSARREEGTIERTAAVTAWTTLSITDITVLWRWCPF